MSSFVHVDNKGKDILILGKGPTQGLGEHSLTAEKIYSVNFTDNGEKYCLSLRYNGVISYLLMVQKLLNLSKRFWDCCNSIMSRKHFKRLISR